MKSLLIAGGREDPNLLSLFHSAQRRQVPVIDLRISRAESPAFSWDLERRIVTISGAPSSPAGAFIRYDVFAGMQDPRPVVSARANAWFQSVFGWVLADPEIRMFNRDIVPAASNKPAVLVLAQKAKLRVPATLVSNEVSALTSSSASRIAKPVAGGDYCYPLDEALGRSPVRGGALPMPAIAQDRLEPPEVRIYVIGRHAFAFGVQSESLDYRVKQDAAVSLLPEVPIEITGLRALMSELKMDFGAADFKTGPDQQLRFLELNTSPMFAHFDQVAQGGLTSAMIEALVPDQT